jgi:hypothetical protein
MTLWIEEVSRISTAQLREQFKPSEFRQLTQATLRHGEASYTIAIERAEGHGCIRHKRVWFRCPCGALAVTIAVTYWGLSCRACRPWRNRGYARRRVIAPHVGPLHARSDAHVAAKIERDPMEPIPSR